jgi:hypothetical protein
MATGAMIDWDMSVEAVAVVDGGDALAAGSGRISRISATGELVAETTLPSGFGSVATITVLG